MLLKMWLGVLSNILAMWKCIKLIWALVHHKDKDNLKILVEFNKAQAGCALLTSTGWWIPPANCFLFHSLLDLAII